TLVPTVDKVDEMILQDTLQVSLAEHKSREEQEARENVELVNEHLACVEIEKMVEVQKNVIDDISISKNDKHNIPGIRLDPRSDKESLEVEFTDVVIHVNVNEEEEEITVEVYELKRKEKGKIVEESRNTSFPKPIRSPRIYIDLVRFMPRKSFATLTDHLQEVTVDSLPTMVKKHVKGKFKSEFLNVMQDIFQMLNNTCHWMGSPTVVDNENDVLLHVDYAKLLWEGIHYSLHHSTSLIPYPRFTKIIIGHYMTNFLEISRLPETSITI
nr:hypothetical protein [Tanacetum cinerariifolium]GFB12820.1 hypothetical protein [Tanacetum cinerariifolium]